MVIYAKDNVKYHEIPANRRNMEALGIQISDEQLLADSQLNNYIFDNDLDTLTRDHRCILLGDFNVKNIVWHNLISKFPIKSH